jgi:hypothetical protein
MMKIPLLGYFNMATHNNAAAAQLFRAEIPCTRFSVKIE